MTEVKKSIELKQLKIEDKPLFDRYRSIDKYPNSESNFTTMFTWSDGYHVRYALVDDFLVVIAKHAETGIYHHLPIGKGDITPVMEYLRETYDVEGKKYCLCPLSSGMKEKIEREMPGKYEFQPMRDSFDYVYSVERLSTLKGKKMNAKRNHYKKFVSTYAYTYHRIEPKDIQRCKEAAISFVNRENKNAAEEIKALERLFDNYQALGVVGAYLEVDHKVVAVTVGEDFNKTVLIHIEKADVQYQGVYAAINKLFLENEWQGYQYVNREEDMGLEGLRKAKMSYKPDFFVEKYIAYPKG